MQQGVQSVDQVGAILENGMTLANKTLDEIFPPFKNTPHKLQGGEEQAYMVQVAMNFVQSMQDSPYFMKPEENKLRVEKYTDKYKLQDDDFLNWTPDWSRLPLELNLSSRKMMTATSNGPGNCDLSRVFNKVERLGAEEEDSEEEEEKKGEEDDDMQEEEEVHEEEEEDDDYTNAYFDNGESMVDHDESDDGEVV